MGVHVVKVKLANGKRAEYHYAWRGGPRINAKPNSHEYLVEFTKLTRDRAESKREGYLPDLIHTYRQSAAYTKLSPDTRRSYDAAIDDIEAEFCDFPIDAISQRGARSLFVEWRDGFADTPRKADILITVLARIFSVAFDRELIDRHPLEKVQKISRGTRKDIIWEDNQREAFLLHASPAMRLAMLLGAWTGQRQGDLLRLPWSAYDGSHIKLRQSKTGRHVRVKVSSELKEALDAKTRQAITILATDRGNRTYTSSGFRSTWGKVCDKAKITGVTFHDLRGTFVTLAYRNGVKIKDIAEITGHSEREAETIIRKHYLAGDNAVMALENMNKPRRNV